MNVQGSLGYDEGEGTATQFDERTSAGTSQAASGEITSIAHVVRLPTICVCSVMPRY